MPPRMPSSRLPALALAAGAAALLAAAPLARAKVAPDPLPVFPIATPEDARTHGLESLRLSLRNQGVPLPPDLQRYVVDRSAAEVLGKALFWDMAVGSDGVQSCASCHFHAGADSRSKNQLNPGLNRVRNQRDGNVRGYHGAAGAGDARFEVVTGAPSAVGPNYPLAASDYPFVTRPNQWVAGPNGVVGPKTPENVNDVASSMGVFLSDFTAVTPGASVDETEAKDDPIFAVGGATVRRVEPRNTPTMINAALNFSNFWDGRANNEFNGRNPFGVQDPSATVYTTRKGKLSSRKLSLRDASLASQAVGPPQSFFEMSAGDGAGNVRAWVEIGAKLLPRRALADQGIDPTDSLLSRYPRHASGKGLELSYQALIEKAFDKAYWSHPTAITLNGRSYSQATANFSFFFGVSVMLYEATLISDQAPFDTWMEAGVTGKGFGQRELDGLNVFVGQGRCINCHGGAEFTNASVRNVREAAIEPMAMGDGGQAVYDSGFYNIGVTLTTDDLGRGGRDLNGKPLAFSRQALFQRLGIEKMGFKIIGNDQIAALSEEGVPVCNDVNLDGVCGENEPLFPAFQRAAVDGAFKAPGLRNVELTGPYFHNGGSATLRQVVQFYDRGGNFCRFNLPNLDPDIQRLGLSDAQEEALVAFLVALTDDRVRRNAAPFDHPELRIPNGSPGNQLSVTSVQTQDGVVQGRDDAIVLKATGAAGGPPIPTFLGLDPRNNLGVEPPADACGGGTPAP